MHLATPLEGAFVEALREYARDPRAFLATYQRGQTTRVVVDQGRRYDAIAVEFFMRARLGEALAPRRGDALARTPLLEQVGVDVIEVKDWGVDEERRWRLDAWVCCTSR